MPRWLRSRSSITATLAVALWVLTSLPAPALASILQQVPGSLVVCKQLTAAIPTATSFTFTTPPGGPAIPPSTVPPNTTAPQCAPGVTAAPGTVAVTEVVPAGFTLQSVTGGTLAGTTATASIVPGQPTTLTFVNVPTGGGGAGLTAAITASPPVANVGAPLTYSVTVTNTTAAAATGVTVTDTLPPGAAFQSATATLGTCTGGIGTPTVTCSIGTLAAGASATATITVTVVPRPSGPGAPLTNTVTATAAGLPPATATAVTPLAGGPFPPGPPPFPPPFPGANLPPVPPPPLEFIPPPGPPPFPPPPPRGPLGAPRPPYAEVPIIPEADSLFLVVGGLATLGGLAALRRLRRPDD
jgi:uncharacterized repeat protein (TIGR01451 family)